MSLPAAAAAAAVRRGRPSLPPEERLRRIKACKEAWAQRNLATLRRIQAEYQRTPEAKARRSELDKLRRAAYRAAVKPEGPREA
jgi:hypothetical protein